VTEFFVGCKDVKLYEEASWRRTEGWKPRYYTGDKVITADHVARFYGA
jgi:hypothetical protein